MVVKALFHKKNIILATTFKQFIGPLPNRSERYPPKCVWDVISRVDRRLKGIDRVISNDPSYLFCVQTYQDLLRN